MSKRPKIKQADGTLLDLPLDAETIKGVTIDELQKKIEAGDYVSIDKNNKINVSIENIKTKVNLNDNGIDGVEYLEILSDISGGIPNAPLQGDIDAFFYSNGISVLNQDNGDKYELYFPAKTGTFAIKTDIPTSINGMSGGTLTTPLQITGGSHNNASIRLGPSGQLIDDSSANYCLFGRNAGTILCGAPTYPLKLRGAATRPTYNEKEVALKEDIISGDLSNYVTLNTEQKITGAKAFTGQVGNIQSESGVYLGLDTNPGAPNANIAITSANSASYIDMGKPNHDYDFRLIKWDSSNGNVAQMCYNSEDGGAYANITIPRASGTLVLTSDLNDYFKKDANGDLAIGNKDIYASTIYANSLQATPDHKIGFTFNEDVQPCIETNGDMVVAIADNGKGEDHYNFKFPKQSGTVALTSDIPQIDNASGVQDIGWTHADMDTPRIATANRIAHWNGAYSGTASNLTYCARGEIASTSDIPFSYTFVLSNDSVPHYIPTAGVKQLYFTMMSNDNDEDTLYLRTSNTDIIGMALKSNQLIDVIVDVAGGNYSMRNITSGTYSGGSYSNDGYIGLFVSSTSGSSTTIFAVRGYRS